MPGDAVVTPCFKTYAKQYSKCRKHISMTLSEHRLYKVGFGSFTGREPYQNMLPCSWYSGLSNNKAGLRTGRVSASSRMTSVKLVAYRAKAFRA